MRAEILREQCLCWVSAYIELKNLQIGRTHAMKLLIPVTHEHHDDESPGRLAGCTARDRANFTGLVLGCIEAKFYKKICV